MGRELREQPPALGRPALAGAEPRRSYLEERDDLDAENRLRLWPYCLRLDETPVRALRAQQAQALAAGAENPRPRSMQAARPLANAADAPRPRSMQGARLPALGGLLPPPLEAHVALELPQGARAGGVLAPDGAVLAARAAARHSAPPRLDVGRRPSDAADHSLTVRSESARGVRAALEKHAGARPAGDEPRLKVAFQKPPPVEDSSDDSSDSSDEDDGAPVALEKMDLAALERELVKVEAAERVAEAARLAALCARPFRRRAPPDGEPPPRPFGHTLARQIHGEERAASKALADAALKDAADAEARLKGAMASARARRASVKVLGALRARSLSTTLALAAATALAAAADDAAHAALIDKRDGFADQAALRRLPAPCPTCGEGVPLVKMAWHALNECGNRLMPCKNVLLGCSVMVRPLNRAWHEDASTLLRPRAACFFAGPAALRPSFAAIDEEDVQPPWTAEFWVWRPSTANALLADVRAALKLHRARLVVEADLALLTMDLRNLEAVARATFASGTADELVARALTDRVVAASEARRAAQVGVGVATHAAFELFRAAGRGLRQLPPEALAETLQVLLSDTIDPLADARHAAPAAIVAEAAAADEADEAAQPDDEALQPADSAAQPADEATPDGNGDAAHAGPASDAAAAGDAAAGDDTAAAGDAAVAAGDAAAATVDAAAVAGDAAAAGDQTTAAAGANAPAATVAPRPAADEAGRRDSTEFVYISGYAPTPLTDALSVDALLRLLRAHVAEAELGEMHLDDDEPAKEPADDDATAATISAADDATECTETVTKLTDKEKRAAQRKKQKTKQKAKKAIQREATHGKSVAKLVEEACLGLRGYDCLAASAACRLLLSCDVDDFKNAEKKKPERRQHATLGVAIIGVGTFALGDEPLPRERWVHVAFVAREVTLKTDAGDAASEVSGERRPSTEARRATVAAFVDGKRVGSFTVPRGVDVRLPMRDLCGDRDSALRTAHAVVVEARYWAASRTQAELRQFSKSFPAPDARAQGLLGWWTWEEGEGSWLFDRSENRYRSRLHGFSRPFVGDESRRMAWVGAEEVAGTEPPTPASLERGVCVVEVRNKRLALKGRELFSLVVCTRAGCEAAVVKCRLRHHFDHDCAKRLVTCDYCAARVTFDALSQHLKRDSPECSVLRQRDVLAAAHSEGSALRECALGCDELVPKRDADRHCRKHCEMRLVYCPQGCGASVAASRLQAHVQRSCGSPFWAAGRAMAKAKRGEAVRLF